MRFQGRVVIVTGAANGIGEQLGRAFAAEGAKLVLADIDAAAGEALCASLTGEGADCRFLRTDVADAGEADALVAAAISAFGRLDIAVNNAGVAHDQCPLHEADDATWQRMLTVNLTGVFNCLRAELRVLLEQDEGGAITNMASIAGIGGAPTLGPYAASKHGVVGLTRTAAVEYGKRGIRVNAVCPSYTRTRMLEGIFGSAPELAAKLAHASPMRRFGEAGEVAATALWLCSEEASFVNGQCVAVDGGITAW